MVVGWWYGCSWLRNHIPPSSATGLNLTLRCSVWYCGPLGLTGNLWYLCFEMLWNLWLYWTWHFWQIKDTAMSVMKITENKSFVIAVMLTGSDMCSKYILFLNSKQISLIFALWALEEVKRLWCFYCSWMRQEVEIAPCGFDFKY